MPQIKKNDDCVGIRALGFSWGNPPLMAPLHGNDYIQPSLELEIGSLRASAKFAQGVKMDHEPS